MTNKPQYRFECRIVDQTTGETIERDFISLPDTDPIGFVRDSIDIHVAQMIRNWRDFARVQYERRTYEAAA